MESNERTECPAEQKTVKKTRLVKTVLPSHMGGGPMGLGDPDSTELRVMEEKVLIPEKMKEKAKILCDREGKVFADCAEKRGFLMPFLCRKKAWEFGACLQTWYDDPEFVQMCTKEYLEERSLYRRTGKTQAGKRFAGVVRSG